MDKKTPLLAAIAGQNRGLLTTEIDKAKVLACFEQLEQENPTPEPLTSKYLEGNWRLLYTDSRSILGLDRFPFLQLGQIYQCIRGSNSKIYNIAEIVGLPFLEGIVSVAATFEAVSSKKVNVKFERSIIAAQKLINYRCADVFINAIEAGEKFLPLDFPLDPQKQQGWLEITYLDEDLRLSRGNQGNIFVLTKR